MTSVYVMICVCVCRVASVTSVDVMMCVCVCVCVCRVASVTSVYIMICVCMCVCRVASVLGYLPQDLIGQVSYEYYHPDDIEKMVHLHHDGEQRRLVVAVTIIRPANFDCP